MFGERLRWLGDSRVRALLVVALFVLVCAALYHEIEMLSWHDVRTALAAVTWPQVMLAFAATAGSYVALAGYDALALRVIGARVPAGIVALTAFVSHAFTFNLGFGLLTGAAVRIRLYGAAGLQPDQSLSVGVLASFGFWLGLAATGGTCLLLASDTGTGLTGPVSGQLVGAMILLGVAALIAFIARQPTLPWTTFATPGMAVMAAAIFIGIADVVASALALWVLLPSNLQVALPAFTLLFATATLLGVISHVPGGLGVFEGVMLIGLGSTSQSAVLASLLLFRLIYYVVPLVLAAGLFTWLELKSRNIKAPSGLTAAMQSLGEAIPLLSAAMAFLGGAVLLISGAVPAEESRLAVLRHLAPLPLVETSHFIASVVGAFLLIIAHGLARRLEGAWRAAVALLLLGACFSILKGIDYEEAAVCIGVATLLFLGRRWFYRQGGALSGAFQPSEILAVGLAGAVSVWIGLMTFRNVTYHDSLWWDFHYHGDASRFMRATLGAAAAVLLVIVYRFIHRPFEIEAPPTATDLARAKSLVDASDRVESHLALIGDKRFLFSERGDGFVMYGVQGSSWIAMGDPVTQDRDVASALVWRFKELVDRHAGVPVFYQVSSDLLPHYLDAGFQMVKLGEEAWVDLAEFTLEGGEGRKLRQTKAKADRSGATIEFVPVANDASHLAELKSVSDAWLAERGQKEKGFSLGFWSDETLTKSELAIVRHEGRAVAFANIWRGANRLEFTVDLMRMRPDAPPGTMDLLFIALMERAKAEGYHWFNLGMAPLSGLPQHRLAPLWSRAAGWFSRHGDRFYNFEGLRAFKSKFKPEWRPKYLAYPSQRRLPQALVDVTQLIANAPRIARAFEEQSR